MVSAIALDFSYPLLIVFRFEEFVNRSTANKFYEQKSK